MWSLKYNAGQLHVGKEDLTLLREHGLSPDGVKCMTVMLGSGRQTREAPHIAYSKQ